jgi:hypothetical protein
MQKVEGSSPFIRFRNPRKSGVFLFWKAWLRDFFSPFSPKVPAASRREVETDHRRTIATNSTSGVTGRRSWHDVHLLASAGFDVRNVAQSEVCGRDRVRLFVCCLLRHKFLPNFLPNQPDSASSNLTMAPLLAQTCG